MTNATVPTWEVADIVLGPVSSETEARDAIVDVLFSDPEGVERRVPAFAGHGSWRVRYSSGLTGTHTFRADTAVSLVSAEGEVIVVDGAADNPLYAHGPLRVAGDQRHLEHADGTPFLWLADSWWNHFMARVTDDEFAALAAKRATQGFSVVHLCVGLYPDPAPFDPSGASTTGWAWDEEWKHPNLAWFDEVDTRLQALVASGLAPCLTGSWGYYLKWLDVEQMMRHWREMIARWGAYPVIWCIAGEPALLYYDDIGEAVGEMAMAGEELEAMAPGETGALRSLFDRLGLGERVAKQMKDWYEVATRVRAMQPFGRPITIQNIGPGSHHELEDWGVIDFFRPSTGHEGYYSLAPSVDAVLRGRAFEPTKPILVGEVNYEQILGSSGPEGCRQGRRPLPR